MTQISSRRNNPSSGLSWVSAYGVLRRAFLPLFLMSAYLLLRFSSLEAAVGGLDHREATLVFPATIPVNNIEIDDTGQHTKRERVIFIISMGAQAANSSLVERFVYSARTVGDYHSWIVVLTDAPEGRYDNLQNYFDESSKDPKSRLVFVHPNAKYYPTISFKNKDMVFKRMKTYILDILDDDRRFDNVGLVYYLDVDNIFANSATNMFQELESTHGIGDHDDPNDTPRIYFFEGDQKKGRGGPLMKFQGGQFILERPRSTTCLERWRYWIDQDPEEPLDQIALLKMSKEFNASNCQMVAMSRTGSKHDRITFPSKKDFQLEAEKYNGMTETGDAQEASAGRDHYPTLIHIKNTGNALEKTNDNDMEVYLRNVLNLTDSSPQDDILGITKKIPRIQASEADLETAAKA